MLIFAVLNRKNESMDERSIGKKVWLRDGNLYSGLPLLSKTEFTLTAILPPKEGEWWRTAVVEREGQTFEVPDYRVVVALSDKGIATYLADNGIYAEAGETSDNFAEAHIEWGDWKHDHMWCDILMGYIGYESTGEETTDENGSDCYSAIHYYYKAE